MALTTPYQPIICECDGSNRSFSVTWPFFDPSDLVVTWVNAAGSETRLALGKDYKGRGGKDGHGCPGVGVIEASGIYAAGDHIRIERSTTISQVDAFANGQFPAKRVERALDRAMMALEELAYGRTSDSVLKVPAGGSAAIEIKRPSVGSTGDVEALVRGLAKANADQSQAAIRDLAQTIAGLKRQIDAINATAVAPLDAPLKPVPGTMSEAIVAALDELNAEAGRRRARIATPGKELVYVQKQNEARAALDDTDPVAPQRHPETGEAIVKYPHLEAMRGVWVPKTANHADDLRAAAIFVLGRAADFKLASSRIEAALDLAKQRLATATTIADVLSVPHSVNWESP